MDHFDYRDGELAAEEVLLSDIAQDVGTPFYCYSTATIERHFNVFSAALTGLDATVCYAVKANSNLAVIRTLANQGAGADVVSSGELTRALQAGVPAEAHFGLGAVDRLKKLVVQWPGGGKQVLEDVEVDRVLVVEESAQ